MAVNKPTDKKILLPSVEIDLEDSELNDKPASSFKVTNKHEIVDDLKKLSEIFKELEAKSIEIAEMLFEYLIDIEDKDILNGTIAYSTQHAKRENDKINQYIASLNRLFKFSRANNQKGGFSIIKREFVEAMDRKTYTFCMCVDGGDSLDILCDIVNTENNSRTPKTSMVKISVQQFATAKDLSRQQ